MHKFTARNANGRYKEECKNSKSTQDVYEKMQQGQKRNQTMLKHVQSNENKLLKRQQKV